MICRRCGIGNPDSAVYCSKCGTPIFNRPTRARKTIPWYLPVGGIVILLLGSIIVYMAIIKSPGTEKPGQAEKVEKPIAAALATEKSSPPLTVGTLIVLDPKNVEVSRLATAVFGNAWIAMPLWALFGGGSVTFQGGDSEAFRVEKGFWSTGDPVVLWQLDVQGKWKAPELDAWRQPIPLEWRPLSPGKPLLLVEVGSPARRDSIITFPLPQEVQGPGVFWQEGRIVGWTFGARTDRGYLWSGPSGKELLAETQVGQFYSTILPNCREEHFSRTLATRDRVPALESLEAFSWGFRKTSLLADEDLPPEFRIHSVIMQMHSLASDLTKNGLAKDVLRILDERILIEDAELILVKDAILAQAKYRDYSRAVQYLEKLKKTVFEKKGQSPRGFDEFQAQLYKDWLREIIKKGGYYSGAAASDEARRAFPDDLEIHLLGVETAMAEQNWERAGKLLKMKDYPSAFKDWADRLDKLIKEGEEGKDTIVLRFYPGEKHIFIEAKINDLRLFKFIVDTGADMTSIPSSAVEALGIKIDDRTPVRLVSTIAGAGIAYEVTLDSIELNKQRIPYVKALIIDIPGYPDYGLLGQNILNNFRIEIDNKNGILRLRKK